MDAEAVLRLFLKFVGWRVETENLDVLRQIVVDFHDDPPDFTRVEEMVYRVFPLIAILPRDQHDENLRSKALSLLQRMRDRDDAIEGCEERFRDLHASLKSRVQLKNWRNLERIYSDFLVGSERTIREFISLQPEAILVIPAIPNTSSHVGNNEELVSVPAKRRSKTLQRTDKSPRRQRARSEHAPIVQTEVKQEESNVDLVGSIRAEMDAVEAKTPWKKAFDLSAIEYPFNEKEHPGLAAALESFWRRYSRAVWERNFWCVDSSAKNTDKNKLQNNRQRSAAHSFVVNVMVPVFDTLGPQFFVDLDKRSVHHPWWWYRQPLVDLVGMAETKGLNYCLRYLHAQVLTRIPEVPSRFRYKTHMHGASGASMWSTMLCTSHIEEAIKKFKSVSKHNPEQQDRGEHVASHEQLKVEREVV